MRDLLIATGTPQDGDLSKHIGPLPDLKEALLEAITFVPEPEFGLNETVNAAPYCDDGSSLPIPLPAFSVASGMVPEGEELELRLLFGDVTVQSAVIFYTVDGTLPTLCSEPGVIGCNPSTRTWTQDNLASNDAIVIPHNQLPVSVYAIQTTTACGTQQPQSQMTGAHYAPYSDIAGPTIYLSDGDTDAANDVVVHQASKFFTRADVAAMPNSELCVRFDFNVTGSPYIRYTTDGSDPLDATEDWWEDPYGVVPYPAGQEWDTQQIASPMWTDYNMSQGECVPIFDSTDTADTLVTVKAQNFVYLGSGPYVGGAITIESYLLVE
jgi:hypothetical protein